MTLSVFPNLDGLELNITKRPEFKTAVFEALSGHESRFKLRRYPKYTFKLNVEFLIEDRDEAQLTELMAFMLNRGGMYEAFLFTDPNDSVVFNEPFGIGDGITQDFQLVRSYGGFTEPVHNLNGADLYQTPERYQSEVLPMGLGDYGAICINDVVIYDGWTASATNLISFATAPAPGAVLTWYGSYYYRVRFLADGYDFAQFLTDLHECKDIEFIGSIRNVV